MDLSASTLPANLLAPVAPPAAAARGANAARIHETAQSFESSFLTAMLQPVFDAMPTDGPFGGGQGEAAFKSLMVDAVAKQTVKAGGIGLSAQIQREMLKLQGAA